MRKTESKCEKLAFNKNQENPSIQEKFLVSSCVPKQPNDFNYSRSRLSKRGN